MNGFLTAQEAADELGYHINHLYYLLREGKVRAQQFNRVWLIDPDEVERVKALQGRGGRLPRSRRRRLGAEGPTTS
jgi:excisionase family DNA binding protein